MLMRYIYLDALIEKKYMTEQIHLTNEDSYDDGYATDYDSEYEYIGECEHYYYLQKPGPLQRRGRGGGRGRGVAIVKGAGKVVKGAGKVVKGGTKTGYKAAKIGIGVGKKVATKTFKKGWGGAKSVYKFLKDKAKKIGKKVYPKKKKPPKLKL